MGSVDHPRGVQPFGNSMVSTIASIRNGGLGRMHALTDALLLDVLALVPAKDLVHLSLSSKSLYAFATHEDLWKALVLQGYEGRFDWDGSWKQTYSLTYCSVAASLKASKSTTGCDSAVAAAAQAHAGDKRPKEGQPVGKRTAKSRKHKGQKGVSAAGSRFLQVRGFYSDLLYQPWFCATVELEPEWLQVDNVDRRSGLSVEDFVAQYEQPNRPVVITDAMSKWPAMKKWSTEYMATAFKGQDVIAGNYEMPFETYLRYWQDNQDEMPLYLFDKTFCRSAPQLQADYEVPPYFADDLFSVLGDDARPDYRWLIMGPARSGSSFHIDPNCTSAWNAVVSGRKKWVLYPPNTEPPGVHASPDGADVATPLSLTEWFMNFYAEAREGKVKPIECVVSPGELIFIPRGWWHMAINLEPGVAITQNYVSRANLQQVLSFLRPGRSDLVSGCSMQDRECLYERFVAQLEKKRPDVLQALQAQRTAARLKIEEQGKLSALFKPVEVAASQEHPGLPFHDNPKPSFSFGFQI